jgi:hypothetical protein
MATMPFTRIARQLAAQGNIRISKSGMNLSGHNKSCQPECQTQLDNKAQPQIVHGNDPNERIPFHWNAKEALGESYDGYVGGSHASLACSATLGQ